MKKEKCNRILPPADLYVCTGDMFPNAPLFEMELKNGDIVRWRPEDGHLLERWDYEGATYPGGRRVKRVIEPDHEREMQTRWVKQFLSTGGFEGLLGNPDAPIVCVRGNHDFINVAELFGKKRNLFEIQWSDENGLMHDYVNEFLVLPNFRVAGFRGINFIAGAWSDELQDAELQTQVDKLPDDFDLLITHVPPSGILAEAEDAFGILNKDTQKWSTVDIGSKQLTSKITRLVSQNHEFVHCFGHNHDCGGQVVDLAGCKFSNASLSINVFDWEKK